MQPSYHQTTALAPGQRALFEGAAITQDENVFGWFLSHPAACFSAEQVWEKTQIGLLTSVRRAVSNLAAQGLLEKTGLTVRGRWGRPVYLYRLAR